MDVETLIGSIQVRPALWDLRMKDYHQRDVHRKLWASVSEETGVQVADAKKKWQCLRDIFRKEYKKAFEHRGCHDDIGPDDSQWYFFGQMLFLKQVMFQHKNHKKMKSDDTTLSESTSTPVDYEEDTSSNSTPAHGSGDVAEPNQVSKRPKRCAEPTVDDIYSQQERHKVDLLTENTTIQQNSDYQFLQSLVPFLMKVPSDRKLIVRHKLLQVLIEEQERNAEMQYYQTAVPSTSTMSPTQLFPGLDEEDVKTRYDMIGLTILALLEVFFTQLNALYATNFFNCLGNKNTLSCARQNHQIIPADPYPVQL